jgi:hypothetical protein
MNRPRHAVAVNLSKPLPGWRCHHCQRFLLEMKGEGEIICPKCGKMNLIKA